MSDENWTTDWTTDQVAEFLKLGSRESARAWLATYGVPPVARQPGRSGLNLYDPNVVRATAARRLGQGYRSDKPPPETAQ